MKTVHYFSRIFVCLRKLCYQTKTKTRPDLHIVGSNRPQDQLWPPSSILGFCSPGHQLHVVALQSTDSRHWKERVANQNQATQFKSRSVAPMEADKCPPCCWSKLVGPRESE